MLAIVTPPTCLFSDWLEIDAICIHQLPYRGGEFPEDDAFEVLEIQHLERINPYLKEELDMFSKLLASVICNFHQNYGDFLSEVAGEAELLWLL